LESFGDGFSGLVSNLNQSGSILLIANKVVEILKVSKSDKQFCLFPGKAFFTAKTQESTTTTRRFSISFGLSSTKPTADSFLVWGYIYVILTLYDMYCVVESIYFCTFRHTKGYLSLYW
jgi:hypothetical protein